MRRETKFHPHTTKGKIIVLHILIFRLLDKTMKMKNMNSRAVNVFRRAEGLCKQWETLQ